MVHDRFLKNYDILKAYARDAPSEPGVYIWKDADNRIIYVGKARILRNRLSSYFSGAKDIKTEALINHANSIETIIVSNEYEALLLENTLIKQHNPKYNINLKDGKTYPVVRITADPYPRVYRTRHIVQDGSLYYGPFANIPALDQTLEMIEKFFPLRKCRTMKKRTSPCMYYHINRCLAPCCGRVEESAYLSQVSRVKKLLAGETETLGAELSIQMKEAAEALKFEEAAVYRNAIRAIESLSENNSVADMDPEDRDYIAWAAEGIFTTFSVLSMRGGRMTGRELYSSRSAAEESETLESFITAYYTPEKSPPPRIYLALPVTKETFTRYFTEQFGFSPELISPAGKEEAANAGAANTGSVNTGAADTGMKRHSAALAMAGQNALEELRRRLRERGAGPALDELKQVLGLKIRPERIEGFDIAQLEGKHPVASLVSFCNGVPDRKNYRYFKLKTVVGIVDDFASMREVVRRRYSRFIREGKELPDLILIDGGIGQVNAASGVLEELGISCDIAGLAKRDEEIWLPHSREPIKLSERSEALKVLQHIRDETHRFATGLNQRLRSGDLYFPALESLEGIGPKRAAEIMKAYGNLQKIAEAEPEEMAEKCRITEAAAKAVRAAAKLAVEDQKEKMKNYAAQKKSQTSVASLAEEAFAAEPPPSYNND